MDCKYKDLCKHCAGLIQDPDCCARYLTAITIGFDKVPDDVGPIDYQKGNMAIQKTLRRAS